LHTKNVKNKQKWYFINIYMIKVKFYVPKTKFIAENRVSEISSKNKYSLANFGQGILGGSLIKKKYVLK